MAGFDQLVGMATEIVMDSFAVSIRWTPASGAPVVLQAIIDHDVERYGPESDVPMKIHTITVRSVDMQRHSRGDQVEVLNDDGQGTGDVYRLQDTIEDDGTIRVIGAIR